MAVTRYAIGFETPSLISLGERPQYDTNGANAWARSGVESPISYSRFVLPALPHRSSAPKLPKRPSKISHKDTATSYGIIYVNEIARYALLGLKTTQFPVNSVIVREKLAISGNGLPLMLAVMVKRERGFNPKAGDWEFLLLKGDASAVTHREKTGECRSCHASQKESDFVFRTYLSPEIRSKLP